MRFSSQSQDPQLAAQLAHSQAMSIKRKSTLKQKQIENGILPKRIPGLQASHPEEGNIGDIREANTMSLFLRKLHKRFGPIASFWEGRQFCVSVASPEYLTPQRHLFDLPDSINESVKILVQEESVCTLNGEEAKRRRQIYDEYFISSGFDLYSNIFQRIAQEYVNKWKLLERDDCIPITRNVLRASIKSILLTCFGETFKSDENVSEIQKKIDWVINHLENPCEPGSIEETTMFEYIKELYERVSGLLKDNIDEVLVWAIYETCLHEDIQDKIYEEIKRNVKDEERISRTNINKLVYLRQVINELMRIRSSAEYTGRKNNVELHLGEYTIPKNTYIYHALAVMSTDDEYWTEAEKFNPDRFNGERKESRHPLVFKPFGFAGKRQCPGQKFALCQMTIFLAEWFRHFQFSLVPGQNYQFNANIAKIDEEIWVKVARRNN
uniref:Cytochrome P450 n=1 Tax=Strigamia maritima TaxID=126957 RepID=T1JHA2_STRMM